MEHREVENSMWISSNLKTFRAGLKTFPKHHQAKVKLGTTNFPYIIHIHVVRKHNTYIF